MSNLESASIEVYTIATGDRHCDQCEAVIAAGKPHVWIEKDHDYGSRNFGGTETVCVRFCIPCVRSVLEGLEG